MGEKKIVQQMRLSCYEKNIVTFVLQNCIAHYYLARTSITP
jgi:hypothetical protein